MKATATKPPAAMRQVPLDSLTHDPRNARKHPERNLAAIRESLSRFGQVLPVVVRKSEIVGGNGMVMAMRELGWTECRVVDVDRLSETDARLLSIALNRTAELAEWDVVLLLEQLRELEVLGADLLHVAGFNDGELAKLLADGTVSDPAAEWTGMPEFDQPDAMPFRSVIVHFTEQAHVDAFATLIGQSISDRTKFVYYPKAERADNTHHRYATQTEGDAEVDVE